MFMLRLLGSVLLLISTLSLINDAHLTMTRRIGILVTPLGQFWQDLSPASLQSARLGIRRSMPWLWDHVILVILQYPGWLVFGIVGAAICYAGRERKRTNIYAN